MRGQPIYWLENEKGEKVTPSSVSRVYIERLQEEFKAQGVETTIQAQRF